MLLGKSREGEGEVGQPGELEGGGDFLAMGFKIGLADAELQPTKLESTHVPYPSLCLHSQVLTREHTRTPRSQPSPEVGVHSNCSLASVQPQRASA